MDVDYETDPTTQSLFPEQVETDRLNLVRLEEERVSLHELHDLLSRSAETERMMANLLREPHDTLRETKEFLETNEQKWRDGSKATYAVFTESGDTLAGTASLTFDWDHRCAHLGVMLTPEHWGHGYSRERAEALVDVAFEYCGVEVVKSECMVGNERAKSAIEKYVDRFGGRYVGVLRNTYVGPDGDMIDCHRFSIARSEYVESGV